jgi:hypothetical protein
MGILGSRFEFAFQAGQGDGIHANIGSDVELG